MLAFSPQDLGRLPARFTPRCFLFAAMERLQHEGRLVDVQEGGPICQFLLVMYVQGCHLKAKHSTWDCNRGKSLCCCTLRSSGGSYLAGAGGDRNSSISHLPIVSPFSGTARGGGLSPRKKLCFTDLITRILVHFSGCES